MFTENSNPNKQLQQEVLDAAHNFATLNSAKNSIEFLDEWFLLSIQHHNYDEDVVRIAAVETYQSLKELLNQLSVLDSANLTHLTLQL